MSEESLNTPNVSAENWKQRALAAEKRLAEYEATKNEHRVAVELNGIVDETEELQHRAVEPSSVTKDNTLILYKYLSAVALKDLLIHGDLKVSYRHDSNDPLEMLPRGCLPDEADEIGGGFMSFTQNANDPAMWGNYASKYTGARIRFEIPYFAGSVNEITADRVKEDEISFDYFIECLVSELCASVTENNFEVHCYKAIYGPNVNNLSCIFKCLYKNDRCKVVSIEELLAKWAKTLTNVSDASSCSVLSRVEEWAKSVTSARAAIDPIVLVMQERIKRVAVKHKTWMHENEFRALVPNDLISRKILKDACIFLTNEFSKHITSITLAPLCSLSCAEANILLTETPNLRKDVTINRASFNKTSFLLDIPGEYKSGRKLFSRDIQTSSQN